MRDCFSSVVPWMRTAGTFLLLGGFLLCITIVWAAIGFLMMGFGLICLLIAERRKKQSTRGPLSGAINQRREPPPLQVETAAQSAEVAEASPSRIDSRQVPFREPGLPRESKPPKPAVSLRNAQPGRHRNEPDNIPYDLIPYAWKNGTSS
jgi:hypothetical protein